MQDHLQSSTGVARQDGTLHGRNDFHPYGDNRGGAALNPLTTKRFTGQYHEQSLPGGEGLYGYGARWYDAGWDGLSAPTPSCPTRPIRKR